MKTNNSQRIAVAIALAGAALLSGCGGAPVSGIPGAVGTALGACAPITTPQFGFTATNVQLSPSNLQAGVLPYGATAGTLLMTGSGAVVPPTSTAYGSLPLIGQNVTGSTIQMTVSPTVATTATTSGYGYGYGYAPSPYGPVNGSGVLTLSTTAMSSLLTIAYQVSGSAGGYNPYGSSYGYNPYGSGYGGYGAPVPTTTQTACVSSMAMNLSHSPITGSYYSPTQLYMGAVYLYINNTQHGVEIDF